MILGNPVPGPIHEKEWVRPPGNDEFEVTSTFADHAASGRAPGIDFGNGQCGAPVTAMAAGFVTQRFTDNNGALIVRVKHADGSVSGYAHLASYAPGTSVGAPITLGQVLGFVGNTGQSSGCHLHSGLVVNGVSVDFWPMLAQNQEDEMTKILTVLRPAATAAVPPNSQVYDAPHLSAPHSSTGTTARELPAAYIVEGDPVNGSAEWVECANNGKRRYFPRGSVVVAQPDPCKAVKADLAAANTRIAAAKVALG